MALQVLTEKPTYGSEIEHHDAVNVAKFGDGYEQRSRNGINTQSLKMALDFSNVTKVRATAVLAFLKAHGGSTPFRFTAPAPYDDQQRQWVIRPPWVHTWTGYDNHTVRVIIEQDFTPGL